jgi:Ca2+-binding EF-hand superfamily protein
MRTRTKVMLAVGAVALGTTTMVGASLADGRGGHHHGGRGGPGGGDRLFEQFDTNGDGLITQAEIDQVLEDRLASFDADNDGSLNLEEYQALWLDAMRERMVDRFQAHDDDGDAVVTVEEFVESYGSMVRHVDRNDDGQITRDDLRRQRDRDRDDDDDDDE